MRKHNVYVDNSCLYIEGQVASAIARGRARGAEDARIPGVRDDDFAVDYRALFLVLGAVRGRAWLVGSRTRTNQRVWRHAGDAGFAILTVERLEAAKEKEVDCELILTALETTTDLGDGDAVTLVTGDRDFAPLVRRLRARHLDVRVMFWTHATSAALIEAASAFCPLEKQIRAIRLEQRVA